LFQQKLHNVIKVVGKALTTIVLLLGLCMTLHAQAQYAESLRRDLVSIPKKSTQYIDTQLKLATELVYVDPVNALENASEALQLAIALNYDGGIATSYRTLGSIYSALDNFVSASDYLQRALQQFERMQDSVGIANCYISLGHTFRRQKNREKEVEYHRKSYVLFKELGLEERIGVAAHNLGESYLNIGELDNAMTLTQEAILINRKLAKLSVLTACYKALGRIHLAEKNLEAAEEAFLQALHISEQLGEDAQKFALMESLISLADLAAQQQQFDQQLQYLQQAEGLNQAYDFFDLQRSLYYKFIAYYLDRGKVEQAQDYLQRSTQVLEEMNTKQLLDRSRLMESALQSLQLQQEARLLETQSRLQQWLLALSAIMLMLLIGFTFYLRKQNKILESSQRTIQAQKEALEELNTTKDKFFGLVAHDLRGPLMNLQQLIDIYFDPDSEEEQSVEERNLIADLLRQSTQKTSNLVTNLIDWASIQMKKEEAIPRRISLNELIRSVLDLYHQNAADKDIRLLFEADATYYAYADSHHVELIVRNLLNNALKFTPDGGSIQFSISDDPKHVYIHVKDTGTGIPEKIQPYLFTISSSQKSVPGTRGEQGSGLGLVLVKEYALMNNGEIRFTTEDQKGTTFSLKLPKADKI
jgi:signal transduction histidine kinase